MALSWKNAYFIIIYKNMQVQVLQHVAFEGPGMIGEWAAEQGHSVKITHLYTGDFLPDLEETDLLVVMGGPMGVHDTGKYAWISAEMEFIRSAVTKKIPIVGICLGSQFIAHALGANVYRNRETEIGWYPLTNVDDVFKSSLGVENVVPFHWHGDTFGLPEGARRLASSEATPNQAYLYGNHVLGLQFHLEVTPESIEGMLDNCGEELQEATYIQSREVIAKQAEMQCELNNQMCRNLLNALLEGTL